MPRYNCVREWSIGHRLRLGTPRAAAVGHRCESNQMLNIGDRGGMGEGVVWGPWGARGATGLGPRVPQHIYLKMIPLSY